MHVHRDLFKVTHEGKKNKFMFAKSWFHCVFAGFHFPEHKTTARVRARQLFVWVREMGERKHGHDSRVSHIPAQGFVGVGAHAAAKTPGRRGPAKAADAMFW